MTTILDLIKKNIENNLYLDPNKIWNESQLNKTLDALNNYSKKYDCEAVVALTDNRQLGHRYFITSKEIAEEDIKKINACERLVAFYTVSDYKNLGNKIKRLRLGGIAKNVCYQCRQERLGK